MRLIFCLPMIFLLAAAYGSDVPFDDAQLVDSIGEDPGIARGDINGNGRIDLVIADRTAGQLIWMENTPGGWVRHLIVNANGINSVAVGDINRDGRLDIVASASSLNTIRWFSNDEGDGSIWTSNVLTASAPQVGAVTVADLDRDGKLDVIAAVNGSDQIRFWRQSSLGWTERTVVNNVVDVRELAVHDINRDGRPDIIALVGGTNSVFWWVNPVTIGDTSPWTSQFIGSLSDPVGLQVVDLDYSGTLDVVAASRSNRQVTLWRGDGTGTIGTWLRTTIGQLSASTSGNDDIQAIEIVDLDRNNSLDVLVATDGQLGWFDHDLATESFTWREISDDSSGSRLLAVDIDRDGDHDLLIAGSAGELLQMHNAIPRQRPAFSQLDLLVASGINQGNALSSTDQVLLTDLIANGRPDIVGLLNRVDAFQFGYSSAWWWRNDPGSITSPSPSIVPPNTVWPLNGMAAADFSGNGHVDLLFGVGSQLIHTFEFCEHLDGFGQSWDCQTQQDDGNLGVTLSIGSRMLSGDINRNGRTDVVAIASTSPVFGALPPTLVWFENQGTGSPNDNWLAHEISQTGATPVALVDIAGNGRLDIVLSDGRIWANNNNGAVWNLNETGITLGPVLAVGDISGNGRPDLLLNGGWAGFDGVNWIEYPLDPAPGGAFGRAWLTDLDGDGDLDIVSIDGSQVQATVRWLENRLDLGLNWHAEDLFDAFDVVSGGALEMIYAVDLQGSDLPELAVRFGQFDYVYRNNGATLGVRLDDTAPGGLLEGQSSEVANLALTHWGRNDDRDLAIRQLQLGFATTTSAQFPNLDPSDISQLVENLSVWNGAELLAEIDEFTVNEQNFIEVDLGPARAATTIPCCDLLQNWQIRLTPAAGAAAAFPSPVYLFRGSMDVVDAIDEYPVSYQPPTRFADLARIQPIAAPPGQFALSVRTTPGGSLASSPGNIDCVGGSTSGICFDYFNSSTSVNVMASPEPGFELLNWSGDCTGSALCTVQMSDHRSIQAQFGKVDVIPTETLTITGLASSDHRVLSSPSGIDCPNSTCSFAFPVDQSLTLTALPSPGMVFQQWVSLQNQCQPVDDPVCHFALPASTGGTTLIGATFQNSMLAYTLSVEREGQGAVISDGYPAINCPGQCSVQKLVNSRVTLTAAPEPGWIFAGWQGGGCTGTSPCEALLDQDQQVTAEFTESSTSLPLSTTRLGQGKVISQPAGIDCGTTCTVGFEQNQVLSLTAIPETGWAFTGWQSSVCAGTGTCDFTLSEATEVSAEFEYLTTQFTLQISFIGPGTVVSMPVLINCTTDCSQLIDENDTIELEAWPDPGYEFIGWSGDCTGTGNCLLTMDQDRIVKAQMAAKTAEYTLSVNKVGVGYVSSTPGGIQCGPTCQATNLEGTEVVLSAATMAGWQFLDWQGACSGTDPVCNLTIVQNQSVTARFEPTVNLAVVTDGQGRVESADGSIDCGDFCVTTRPWNTAVSLSAIPAPGWQIDQWGFAAAGCTDNPDCLVTLVDQDRVAGVRFIEIPQPPQFTLTVNRSGPGTVASSPVGILCGSTCSANFMEEAEVTLIATPDTGAVFNGWLPAALGCGASPSCTLTLSQSRTIGASFSALQDGLFQDRFETDP